MLKNTSNLSCREDGFTLIELLIVIVIIGVLAAIAIPVFLSQAQAARNASVDSDTRNAASKVAQEVATKGFPTVAADITALENKLTKSNGNQLKIASAANGNYTVTGWNDDAEKYSVVFTSANGKFVQDKTSNEVNPNGNNAQQTYCQTSNPCGSVSIANARWADDGGGIEVLTLDVSYLPYSTSEIGTLTISNQVNPTTSTIQLTRGTVALPLNIQKGSVPAGAKVNFRYTVSDPTHPGVAVNSTVTVPN